MGAWRVGIAAGLAVAAGLAAPAGAQAPAYVLKDLRGPTSGYGSYPGAAVASGPRGFFSAGTAQFGRELWRTDGTAAGTRLVADIRATSGSDPVELTDANGLLFFAAASDYTNELWRSNGTKAGTVKVSTAANPDHLAYVNGWLLFFAAGANAGRELWRSDASAAGTQLVKDIRPGTGSSVPEPRIRGDPTTVVTAVANGLYYFAADDGTSGLELWRSDGTSAGTQRVIDLRPGAPGGLLSAAMAAVGDELFFAANDGVVGTELWKTDGTAAGTLLVKDLRPGVFTSSLPQNLVDVGGRLFFTADDGASGRELWSSDGTPGGTALVRDIRPGPLSSSPRQLTAVGSTLFFTVNDGPSGVELWRSDGTADGTARVADIEPGSASSSPSGLTSLGGAVLFAAFDAAGGTELWRSDGTEGGTVRLADIVPGAASSSPDELSVANGVLYFSAFDPVLGRELWRSDGTPGGTALVKDVGIESLDSNPAAFAQVGSDGPVILAANDGTPGEEIWSSDGTPAGTQPIADLQPGSPYLYLYPTQLGELGGLRYFRANGAELWKTDGTSGGTELVRAFPFNSASSFPDELARYDELVGVGGRGYFSAWDPATGWELWQTDGTTAGTQLLELVPGEEGSFPSDFLRWNGRVFFTANGGLWRTDPSAGPIQLAASGSCPRAVGGSVLFVGFDAARGYEFWRTGGLVGDATPVSPVVPGNPGATMFCLGVVDGTLFYAADGGLWKTDGTAAGTRLVKQIPPGPAGWSSGDWFAAIGGLLFFVAYDGTSGSELWRSDGTAAGTALVKDIYPGPFGLPGHPSEFREVDGKLVFHACTPGEMGCEVWASDGTPAGTVQLADVVPGSASSDPTSFTPLGSQILFAANDPAVGRELWAIPKSAIPDADGDGLFDVTELSLGTNPNAADSDQDGLSDADERRRHHTDPLDADSDGDGASDGLEVQAGSDPLDAASQPPPPPAVPALPAAGAALLAALLAATGWRRIERAQR